MAPQAALGLFGKLPWDGDFIQRGLPSRFVRPWDEWLSHAMAASREALGADWSEAYLLSPPWRFLIEPGIIGATGWAGVLASSVDRVRRYFPLTLALELPASEARLAHATRLKPLLQTLEQTGLSIIETEQPLDAALAQMAEAVETALADIAASRPKSFIWAPDRPASARAVVASGGEDAPLAGSGDDAPGGAARSCWWHDRWDRHAAAVIRCEGLPAPAAFAGFFDGAWQQHGWQPAAGDDGS